jgi:hypothetical protein
MIEQAANSVADVASLGALVMKRNSRIGALVQRPLF